MEDQQQLDVGKDDKVVEAPDVLEDKLADPLEEPNEALASIMKGGKSGKKEMIAAMKGWSALTQSGTFENFSLIGKSAKDLCPVAVSITASDGAAWLKELCARGSGKKLLDGVVQHIGSGGDDKAFGLRAIEARYGVKEVKGDFGAGPIKRIYNALALVPSSHVDSTVNTMLETIEKGSSKFGASEYGGKKITLNYLSSTMSMKTADRGQRMLGGKYLNKSSPFSQRLGDKNMLDEVTLHEVGHAVDAKLNVMPRFGERPAFGGWNEFNGGSFDPYKEFSPKVDPPDGMGPDTFKEMLKAVMAKTSTDDFLNEKKKGFDENQKKRKDFGMDPAPAIDWKAVKTASKNNTAVKAIMNGHEGWGGLHGAWQGKRSELADKAIDGRVYHQSYADSNAWVSYLLKAKDIAVSHYQFRAPGEWFAELYAAYYLGSLQGHPLYDWFEKNIHEKETLDPKQVEDPEKLGLGPDGKEVEAQEDEAE